MSAALHDFFIPQTRLFATRHSMHFARILDGDGKSPGVLRGLVVNLSSPGVVSALQDLEAMAVWECLRTRGRVTVSALSTAMLRTRDAVQRSLDVLLQAGLVKMHPAVARRRAITWCVMGDPLVVTYDVGDGNMSPASVEEIRALHLQHLRHIVSRFETVQDPSGLAWRLDAVQLVAIDAGRLDELNRRIHALLEYVRAMHSDHRTGSKNGDPLFCNHGLSIRVTPIDGPALALPNIDFIEASKTRMIERAAPDNHQPASRLARREREIALALAQGLTRRQVAQALSLSAHTVATVQKRIHRKLGIHTRGQLVAAMLYAQRAEPQS